MITILLTMGFTKNFGIGNQLSTLKLLIATSFLFAVSFLLHVPVAEAITCPCTIWSSSTTPANLSVNNTTAVELGVKFKVDTAGYITGIRFYKASNNTGTHIGNLWKADGTLLSRATFTNESTSGWQQATFSQPVQITPNANYVASYFAPNGNYAYNSNFFANQGIDNGPLHALKNGISGGNGVYIYNSNTNFPNKSYNSTNYWVDVVFETKTTSPKSTILLITTGTNKYTSYYTEILKNEGYSFETSHIDDLSSSLLSAYDVVILGEISLSNDQVTTLTNWVSAGGNLIAMRPDKKLADLAELSDTGSTLTNKYLKITTTNGPGNGLTNQSMQFHGTADLYNLNGATSIAELFSNAATGSGKTAVSLTSVGSVGGQVAVFTYDLAKSVVLTRQGNPAWIGQNRETVDGTIRSDDLFYGNASFDPQTDWVDLNKVAIPQADEQQRLLSNLITQMNLDKKPIPHFWYLPKGKKAAVIMTADDHAVDSGAQVISRLQHYIQQSPSGCKVALWECIRASSYFYLTQSMSTSQAQSFVNQGFDLGVHLIVNGSSLVNGFPSNRSTCGSYNQTTIRTYLSQQLATFKAKYPAISPVVSNRTHCIVWSDWVSQAKAESDNGIRMDTNYYYWPGTWVQNRPGMMNGGGFPMRFADTDGSLIDTYQAMTQMQDEGPVAQTYPFTINTLLDNALGSNGYYGAFTANMHSDRDTSRSDAIVASAKARGVPVVSARQMTNWLDGRNESKITNLTWNGSDLTFTISVANGAQNLLFTMLPTESENGALLTITKNSNPVTFTTETIKGIQYAKFAVTSGIYTAVYGNDTSAPTITSASPTNGTTNTSNTAKVTATFNESIDPASVNTSTFELHDNSNEPVTTTVTYDQSTKSAISTPTQPLTLGATYTATIKGNSGVKDLSGNFLGNDYIWSFTIKQTLNIWNPDAIPSSTTSTDTRAVELGVRFKSSINGYIKGIRFYKGTGNTGTHKGTLWEADGTELRTAVFTNESASGWQQVLFQTPVTITANTPYIASYFAPSGHYAFDSGYFASSGQDNGTLHAYKDTATARNGLYKYTSTSAFPTSSWTSTNYWIDIIFSTNQ